MFPVVGVAAEGVDLNTGGWFHWVTWGYALQLGNHEANLTQLLFQTRVISHQPSERLKL